MDINNEQNGSDHNGFKLEKPVLVCRWRLANRQLPMENRHFRALSLRTVAGEPVGKQLIAWAKQHVEWTLDGGAVEHPCGVLMLVVDEKGQAAMTVGPYEPLANQTTAVLLERAKRAAQEAEETGVAPETLWAVEGDALVWASPKDSSASGAASLIFDLARTLGMPVHKDEGFLDRVARGDKDYDELFLVSDEHGVVPASEATGKRAERFAAGYKKLLDSMDAKRPR